MVNGINFCARKNDSGDDVAESCYTTFNDMMRKDESDTDPDVQSLKGPMGLSPRGRDGDSNFSEMSTRRTYESWWKPMMR